MNYEAIVVGGGIAGLTTACYLGRAGKRTLLLEQGDHLGGLVVSFERDGYVFDGGIRAFENSGIVKPMLKQLGITVDFVRSPVSIGIGTDFIFLKSEASIIDYEALLVKHFPAEEADIRAIIGEVKKVMGYMDVLYGIDNPLFLDSLSDSNYIFRTLLPWLMKYKKNVKKAMALKAPINDHLALFTKNRALIDIISQHFFRQTPAFFALSYFSLYLDYNYPMGGTGSLIHALETYARAKAVEIKTKTTVVGFDPEARTVRTAAGEIIEYQELVWTADMNAMYRSVAPERRTPPIQKRLQRLEGKTGGDSVFTVYLEADVPPAEFARTCGAHSFYTPVAAGLGNITADRIDPNVLDESGLPVGLADYFANTTYEISIPCLRDPSLAPAGKTGLIVSALMDYCLVARIRDDGHYEAFKKQCEKWIVDTLAKAAFPMLRGHVDGKFSSTPLTIERDVKSFQGAITGWAFTNDPIPAEHGFSSILKTIDTAIPHVWQAGQWTFAPAGLPISALTGKLAADAVVRRTKKTHR
ncbi:MAG TPA: NAD(P)/FAD-dependent oxidoreductase [Acholeplasmatales bacterium]|nr:NAD(P)/FAD-dependent oxidoreductase [Acholeplasmatales bacterium]